MTAFTVEKSAGITTLGLFLTASGVLVLLSLGSSFWTTAGIALVVTGFLLLLIGVHRALSSLDALALNQFPAAEAAQSTTGAVLPQ